jgi:DNA-binding XRE family transcriptional regulator
MANQDDKTGCPKTLTRARKEWIEWRINFMVHAYENLYLALNAADRVIDPNTPGPFKPYRNDLEWGPRFGALRRSKGWTQREIAQYLGVSSRTIIRFEKGGCGMLHGTVLAITSLVWRFARWEVSAPQRKISRSKLRMGRVSSCFQSTSA